MPPQLAAGARVLLDHPDVVVSSSMREIAAQLGAAPATLVRLARHPGFADWSSLRTVFVDACRSSPGMYSRGASALLEGAASGGLLPVAARTFASNMERLLLSNEPEVFEAAVRRLAEAPRILVAAFLSCRAPGQTFTYVARLFRDNVHLLGASGSSPVADLAALGPQDVVLSISFQPYAKESLLVADAVRWRRGWHPERIAPRRSERSVLVGGGGPAGLEAALSAGRRGYEVHLAEAGRELGGRVTLEARLRGLAEWASVRDWRLGQIARMPNVHVYRESPLSAQDVLDFGAGHVAIATGTAWRRDGVGREHGWSVPGFDLPGVLTPDDLMAGARPQGPIVVWDDDLYCMGGVLAEHCRSWGLEVALVTPAGVPSPWTANTLEAGAIQKRLVRSGIAVVTSATVTAFHGDHVEIAEHIPGTTRRLPAASVVTVTARLPREALHEELAAAPELLAEADIATLQRIGDVLSPSTIQAATYWGHRFARELDEMVTDPAELPRELPQAAPLRRHWTPAPSEVARPAATTRSAGPLESRLPSPAE